MMWICFHKYKNSGGKQIDLLMFPGCHRKNGNGRREKNVKIFTLTFFPLGHIEQGGYKTSFCL